MNIEDFRAFCLELPNVTESFPFDKTTLVFKVYNKMFALCDVDDFTGINLKGEPEKNLELREQYEAVNPGYHMNKTHWNTVGVNQDVDDILVLELTKESYDLILNSIPKSKRI